MNIHDHEAINTIIVTLNVHVHVHVTCVLHVAAQLLMTKVEIT